MTDVEVRKLRHTDRRGLFDCGEPVLNRFLKERARQAQDRGQSVTYVALDGDEVIGYVTLLPAAIDPELLRARAFDLSLPRQPVPVLLLARMGTTIDTRESGTARRRIGTLLMDEVRRRAREVRALVGCVGVLTDAKPGSQGFYARHGFAVLEDPPTSADPTRMFAVFETFAPS